MSIDELAAAAADDLRLVARARTDVTLRRGALERTVQVRRRRWTVAAMVAAIAVVLVGTSLVTAGHAEPPTAPPVPSHQPVSPHQYTGNGPLLVETNDGFQLIDPRTGARTSVDVRDVNDTERTAWSPDGSRVAFFSPARSAVVDVDAGRTTLVHVPEAEPFPGSWYPSGRVVWSTDGTFSTQAPEGLGRATVPLPSQTRVLWVSWSPDGLKAAFATWDDAADRRLYVVDADGSGLHQLPAKATPEDGGPLFPTWSPDGSHVLYTEIGPDQDGNRTSVMIIRPDGSGRTRVADLGPLMGMGKWETYPVWSPDSREIAFFANFSARENDWGLYVTDLQGHVRQIPTGGRPTAPALAWRPVP